MRNIEKLYFYTNRSPVWLFFRILFWILLFDIILILTFSIVDYVSLEKYVVFWWLSFEEHIIIVFLFIHLFMFLYLFIEWFYDFYSISSEKVEHDKWILFKKKQIFVIDKIDSISIYQSFMWRLLNYWDISFYYNEQEFTLKAVPYPEEFVEFLDLFKRKIINK